MSKPAFGLTGRTLAKGVVILRTERGFPRALRRMRFLRYANLFGWVVAVRKRSRA
jgi:hypothetical protein